MNSVDEQCQWLNNTRCTVPVTLNSAVFPSLAVIFSVIFSKELPTKKKVRQFNIFFKHSRHLGKMAKYGYLVHFKKRNSKNAATATAFIPPLALIFRHNF
jgi:hypothetical protein